MSDSTYSQLILTFIQTCENKVFHNIMIKLHCQKYCILLKVCFILAAIVMPVPLSESINIFIIDVSILAYCVLYLSTSSILSCSNCKHLYCNQRKCHYKPSNTRFRHFGTMSGLSCYGYLFS